MKKFIICLLTILLLSQLSVFAYYHGEPGGINYASNIETTDFVNFLFYYDGYVQVTPSYNHNGWHYIRGRITYVNADGVAYRYYTANATSTNQPGILSKSQRFYDDYYEFIYKTEFYYFFYKALPGTSVSSPNKGDELY